MAEPVRGRYTVDMPRSQDLWKLLRARAARLRLPPTSRGRLRRAWLPLLAVFALVLLVDWLAGGGSRAAARLWPRPQILDAICFVESSHRADPPDGDLGKAIGPYQIHEVYWRDAIAADPGLGGSYQDCRQRAYAERVIAAYMQRYVPEAWAAGDAEVIARVHNGGPTGHRESGTLRYWQRVLARLCR